MNAYLPHTDDDLRTMLARIGVGSIDDLFAGVPASVRMTRPLDLPAPLAEQALTHHMTALAAKNDTDSICFLGGGAYDRFIPTVVDTVAGRSEFYTSYTPYQAEASQGTLQAIFEYQTLIARLTGLPIANASLYEGGSAVAEAVLMALHLTGRESGEILIAGSVHPEYRQVLETYMTNLSARVRVLPTPNGVVDPDDVAKAVTDQTVAVVVQSPNFYGHLEEMAAIGEHAHKVGALFIASFDPISLGLLAAPGAYGADIAVAEGQGLGIPLGYGGPYLGILACRNEREYLRKIPGRLVGQTLDRDGKRSWVLTLQPREQHIARHRATSNICTNQGLMALRAVVYLAALGPQGLRETAELCLRKAHYLAGRLAKIPGVTLPFKAPYFQEFTIRLSKPVPQVLAGMRRRGYLAGLPLGQWDPTLADCISVAVTEKRTRAELDGFAEALSTELGG